MLNVDESACRCFYFNYFINYVKNRSHLWTYSTNMFISTNALIVVSPSEWIMGQLSSIIHGLLDAHKLRGLKSLSWCWTSLTVEMSFCLMCSSRRLCRNVPPMRKSNATRPSPSAPSAGKQHEPYWQANAITREPHNQDVLRSPYISVLLMHLNYRLLPRLMTVRT